MSTSKRIFTLAMAGALLGACAMLLSDAAFAQAAGPGRGRNALEKNEKAWDIEAQAMAQNLSLSPELAAKLADAYKAARNSVIEATHGAGFKPGERPDFDKMREIGQAEKTKFETALKAFLTPEQTAKVVPLLGGGGRRLDPMAMALDGMNLDEKAKPAAWKLVFDYVAEATTAMQAAAGGTDYRGAREKMMQLKEKLDGDLAKVLSPEQMTKWKESTAMPAGQRRDRGPRGPQGPEPKPAAK